MVLRRWMTFTALSLVVGLLGCDVVSGLDEFSASGEGPGGSSSQGGSGGSTTVGGGGAGGDSPRTISPCGFGGDDFGDGILADAWIADNLGDAWTGEGEGTLKLRLWPGDAFRRSMISSDSTYAISNCAVPVEVKQVSVDGPSERLYFRLGINPINTVAFRLTDGALAAHYSINDNDTQVWQDTFDPDQHRWWAFEVVGREVTWLVSPDGLLWNVAGSATVDFVNQPMGAQLFYSASWGSNPADGGTSRFDNFNLPPGL